MVASAEDACRIVILLALVLSGLIRCSVGRGKLRQRRCVGDSGFEAALFAVWTSVGCETLRACGLTSGRWR